MTRLRKSKKRKNKEDKAALSAERGGRGKYDI